jgi:PEP-CTERM motif
MVIKASVACAGVACVGPDGNRSDGNTPHGRLRDRRNVSVDRPHRRGRCAVGLGDVDRLQPGRHRHEFRDILLLRGAAGISPASAPRGRSGTSSYAGPGNAAFPVPAILTFESIGGLTFDLTAITYVNADTSGQGSLTIAGVGLFHKTGFEDTADVFNFSGQNILGASGTFSFSASNAAAVPEPGTLILLGSGLLGVSVTTCTRPRSRKNPTAA